nr:MAG TPA: hypothetical protein [Caudoviricetes sp.]
MSDKQGYLSWYFFLGAQVFARFQSPFSMFQKQFSTGYQQVFNNGLSY